MRLLKIISITAISTLLPAFVTFASTDIVGWGKLKWGMTYGQVASLYQIESFEEFDEYIEERNARIADYVLKNFVPDFPPTVRLKQKITIQGHKFAVLLCFDQKSEDSKLYKIELHSHTNESTVDPYASISELLVRKYGDPSYKKQENISGYEITEMLWGRPSGRIKLGLRQVSGEFALCQIEYIARIDKL